MNTPPLLGQNRELADQAGFLTACHVGFFTTCLMNMPPVLRQNRELADQVGVLSVNPKTLQHVK